MNTPISNSTIKGQDGCELLNIDFSPRSNHLELIEEIYNLQTKIKKTAPVNICVPERIKVAYSCMEAMTKEQKGLVAGDICRFNELIGESGKFREPEDLIGVRIRKDQDYVPAYSEYLDNLILKFTQKYLSARFYCDVHPLEFFCRAYLTFELIHPFSQGNGRVGRLLLAWLLLSHGYNYLAPLLEPRWGNDNPQHNAAFETGFEPPIGSYWAWLSHPKHLNYFFDQFYLYFLREIGAISRLLL